MKNKTESFHTSISKKCRIIPEAEDSDGSESGVFSFSFSSSTTSVSVESSTTVADDATPPPPMHAILKTRHNKC